MSTPVIEAPVRILEYGPSTDGLFELFPYEDLNDANHRTHIINPTMNPHLDGPGLTGQDIVDAARMSGQEITALCGYTWVPKHNPEKFDICEACMKIAQEYMSEDGE